MSQSQLAGVDVGSRVGMAAGGLAVELGLQGAGDAIQIAELGIGYGTCANLDGVDAAGYVPRGQAGVGEVGARVTDDLSGGRAADDHVAQIIESTDRTHRDELEGLRPGRVEDDRDNLVGFEVTGGQRDAAILLNRFGADAVDIESDVW